MRSARLVLFALRLRATNVLSQVGRCYHRLWTTCRPRRPRCWRGASACAHHSQWPSRLLTRGRNSWFNVSGTTRARWTAEGRDARGPELAHVGEGVGIPCGTRPRRGRGLRREPGDLLAIRGRTDPAVATSRSHLVRQTGLLVRFSLILSLISGNIYSSPHCSCGELRTNTLSSSQSTL